jgi:cystathionine beta-lyase/cystathionine gamma-synthase
MENLVIDPISKEYLRNKSNKSLKLKIGLLYNQNNIILTNSGLHSNYIVINTIVNQHKNINIIYGNELYHESIDLIKYHKNINLFNINNLNLNNIKNQNNILFIESCSNPNGYIFDFSLIKQMRKLSLKLYVICDNTWLTSVIFNPFDYDVDIVTSSLSKFYSGGYAICGVCLFKNINDYETINNYIKIAGIHISPLQLNIINEQINYVEERINRVSNLTCKILDFLLCIPNILINHPYLETSNLRKLYFKNNLIPSTFTIGFKISQEKLFEIINKLTIIKIETSFGSSVSKIDTFINVIDDTSLIRLSLGYDDDFDRIKSGLEELFQYIKKIE